MGVVDEASSLVALRAALGVAARNRGAPGPDGVTVAELAAQGDVGAIPEAEACRSNARHLELGGRKNFTVVLSPFLLMFCG